MRIEREWIKYGEVKAPTRQCTQIPVNLTVETMQGHKQKILTRMKEKNMDVLFVYADREHGANFGYLTGFEPRFEESVLVLHQDGEAFLMLGNESLRMAEYSRIKATRVHVPMFSLPNQPMQGHKAWLDILTIVKLKRGMRAGIAGWKIFTCGDADNIYDVPSFIVDSIKTFMGGTGSIEPAADLFIHPEYGARILMNANEIAHYEFGASLASYCVGEVLDKLQAGKSELELADCLSAYGQPVTVQTICATGERFMDGGVAPRNKQVKLGDRFTVTMGLRGGLTCRVAYAAQSAEDLPVEEKNYLNQVAIPYYHALAEWYAAVKIGERAGEIYRMVENVIPWKQYGVQLNPGHYTASEEWMSSPMRSGSDILLKSGMLLQADIIVKVAGYGGCNAEDGIALGDVKLRDELKQTYPETWERMQRRRTYMQNILGMKLGEEVLPMSDLCGYVRPYMLEKKKALCILN